MLLHNLTKENTQHILLGKRVSSVLNTIITSNDIPSLQTNVRSFPSVLGGNGYTIHTPIQSTKQTHIYKIYKKTKV